MSRQKGFTLMELMVVVAIIGIIAAVAYPSFIKAGYKGRRADAKAAILQATQALERCYTTYGVYKSTNCPEYNALTGGAGSPIVTPKGYYTISSTAANITGTSYTVTATANTTSTTTTNAAQKNDTGCTIMSMDNTGRQTSGGNTTDTGGCW